MHRTATLIGTFLVVLSFLPTGAATNPLSPALPTMDAACAPPCGYIYPTIGMDSDLKVPYPMTQIADLPTEVHIDVSYAWDMEQEGTGIPADAEAMELTFLVTRKPQWLDAELDRLTCEFVLIPAQNAYDVCDLVLTLSFDPDVALPTTEEEFLDLGKRVMIFATSRETGTFKKSYGVEDLRFKWDGETTTTEVEEAPTLAPLLGLAATAALVAIARRRRL